MLEMPEDPEDPSSRNAEPVSRSPAPKTARARPSPTLIGWIRAILSPKPDPTLREAIEEYIDEPENYEDEPTLSAEERTILGNILELQKLKVTDVMVPRADIVAISIDTSKAQLLDLLSQKQYSRIPVYKENLDHVAGTIHIKDIMAKMAKGEKIVIADMLTDVPIVSPSLSIIDLVIKMRQSRRHMVLVVDEYGGIDGLVTIGDVVETIIGEIDDEHDTEEDHEIVVSEDGVILADGRVDIEEFEERFGHFLSDEEREDSDTLGGLVSALAGRVPARGEILTHTTGLVFEVLDADPRRVNRLKIYKTAPLSAE